MADHELVIHDGIAVEDEMNPPSEDDDATDDQ